MALKTSVKTLSSGVSILASQNPEPKCLSIDVDPIPIRSIRVLARTSTPYCRFASGVDGRSCSNKETVCVCCGSRTEQEVDSLNKIPNEEVYNGAFPAPNSNFSPVRPRISAVYSIKEVDNVQSNSSVYDWQKGIGPLAVIRLSFILCVHYLLLCP